MNIQNRQYRKAVDSDHWSIKLRKLLLFNPGYSPRRFFVDTFYFERVELLQIGCRVLDLGGKKFKKRGEFDISCFPLQVDFANINRLAKPDVLCDAVAMPIKNESYDAVILSEILEHVPDPKIVLKETFRVLKIEGKALITVPFMFHIHPDPSDFGRYTDFYWQQVATRVGFSVDSVQKHGGFYALVANLVKIWPLGFDKGAFGKVFRKLCHMFYPMIMIFLMWLDRKYNRNILEANTLGFEMVFVKKTLSQKALRIL